MNGMLERVTRAILAVEDGSWCLTPGIEVDLARAAIEAMREPTEAMITAYDGQCDHFCLGESLSAESAWKTMINEVLES